MMQNLISRHTELGYAEDGSLWWGTAVDGSRMRYLIEFSDGGALNSNQLPPIPPWQSDHRCTSVKGTPLRFLRILRLLQQRLAIERSIFVQRFFGRVAGGIGWHYVIKDLSQNPKCWEHSYKHDSVESRHVALPQIAVFPSSKDQSLAPMIFTRKSPITTTIKAKAIFMGSPSHESPDQTAQYRRHKLAVL